MWATEHKKDPGIPNNFPYKDAILAEVAEQRRIVSMVYFSDFDVTNVQLKAAEEKQKRKEGKKGSKVEDVVMDEEDELEEDEEEEEVVAETSKDLNVGIDGILSLSAKRLIHAKARVKEVPVAVEEEPEEEVPILINRDLPNLQAVLDDADVLVEVLDARDPLSFRSAHLEELVAAKPNRKILLVLNKIGG